MALRSIDELINSGTLAPNSEGERIQAIANNRRLYDGNPTALNLGVIDDDIPAVWVNWFKRVADFYPEFMFSSLPQVTIEGDERAQEFADSVNREVWLALQSVFLDVVRYGYGVVTTHPNFPTQPWSVEPDSHYEVTNPAGETVTDLIVRVRSRNVSRDEQGRQREKVNASYDGKSRLDVYVYNRDGTAELRTYNYPSGSPGTLLNRVALPPRAKDRRQVVEVSVNPQRMSMFPDIEAAVAEIGRTWTSLARSNRKNLAPHLSGPDSSLEEDDDGNVRLDPNGQFLPRNDGDPEWAYVQFDSKLEPARYSVDLATETVFAMTGLSRFLFSSDNRQNIFRSSATSLRRLMIPFAAKVANMQTHAEDSYERLLDLLNQSRSSDVLEIDRQAISIYWPFEELWQADDPQDNDDGSDLSRPGQEANNEPDTN